MFYSQVMQQLHEQEEREKQAQEIKRLEQPQNPNATLSGSLFYGV